MFDILKVQVFLQFFSSMLARITARRNVANATKLVRFCSSNASASASSAVGSTEADVDSSAGNGRRGPYRQQRAAHNRVFRWGVGNAFRSASVNRYSPVHHERPKELTVRDDYYDTDNNAIQWEPLNEAWEVFWYEHGKLNAKPFPVKKFGLERAKTEAIKFYDELKETNRITKREDMEVCENSGEDGVFFDERTMSWVSLFWKKGRPACRTYSSAIYGHDGAKALAISDRKENMGQFQNINQ